MLEKKRSKGSIKLGAENISGMLLTQKQGRFEIIS